MMKDNKQYRVLIVQDNEGNFTIVEDFFPQQHFSTSQLPKSRALRYFSPAMSLNEPLSKAGGRCVA